MDVFHVQTASVLVGAIHYAFIIAGVVTLAVGVALFFRRSKDSKPQRGGIGAILTGIILLATGAGLLLAGGGSPSVIVIRPGSFSVSGGFIGNSTYTSSEVKEAFVGNLYTGNLTLSARNGGTSLGDIKEGVFTLSNGAAAHVVTVNETDLFVKLDTGLYIVLGTTNTASLVSDFSANVAPVAGA